MEWGKAAETPVLEFFPSGNYKEWTGFPQKVSGNKWNINAVGFSKKCLLFYAGFRATQQWLESDGVLAWRDLLTSAGSLVQSLTENDDRIQISSLSALQHCLPHSRGACWCLLWHNSIAKVTTSIAILEMWGTPTACVVWGSNVDEHSL